MSMRVVLSVFLIVMAVLVSSGQVQAANLDQAFLRLDRMTTSTATGGTVCLEIATTASTDAHVEVTFPTDFTVNGTAGNWTVTTTNLPLGATAMPGVNTAENVTSQTVRFPITDISGADTLYCFNFTGSSTLTTKGSTGNDLTGYITVTDSGDVAIDTAQYATALITDDQVVITATVPPTFSFSIAGSGAQALGVLSTSSVTSGGGNAVTFGTNAGNGWVGWILSANQALDSAATGDSIETSGTVDDSPSTLSAGTEGYVVDADLTTDSGTSGTGTVTIDPEYLGTTTSQGGTLPANFEEFATADGPTDGDVVTLVARASISALTKAATDYTDTWTVVGAANF